MSEFKPTQIQLQQIRKDRRTGTDAVFRANEKLKKMQRAKLNLRRRFNEDSDVYLALLQQESRLKKELSAQQSKLSEILETENTLLDAFFPFTDPRKHIQQFSDDFPILMFPVRLETRFKKIPLETGEARHQLWVRVFPDECSIDTFDDTLSEAEVTKARNYWIQRWIAGKAANEAVTPFVENKQKGAWRELMGTLNGGRAYWITQNYIPVNAAEIPNRQTESDVFLVISTEDLPDPAVQDALKNYWRAIYLANGDADSSAAAFEALAAATGGDPETTLELVGAYTPQNIDDERIETDTAPDISVAFLEFPKSQTVATKLSSWSRAARVTTFPDRLVLLGYQKGNPDPVVNQLGNGIPDPLVVGPNPGEDINEILKAVFGPEFENLPDEEKAAKYVEYLSERSDTRWLFDFEEAVEKGMGFKVDLSEENYNRGFERLFVLGVKLSADESEGHISLEQLIEHHHFGDSGFSILPQGTATNNTEESRAGFSEIEDADDAYLRYHWEPTEEDPEESDRKRDGRWLAELLGIDVDDATLRLTANYFHKDQSEARAMNAALWNATLGYFMESMMTPVFNDGQRDFIRWFLINHVSGRGCIPAIRIGNQPYGILPVSTISSLKWLAHDSAPIGKKYGGLWPALRKLYAVLSIIKKDWEALTETVAYVGKRGDAHQILLEALGLHATSVEFDQRYAQSFQQLFNELKLRGIAGEFLAAMIIWDYQKGGMDLLKKLGYVHDEKLNPKIPILEKFFLTRENDVNKPLIDDRPLSEEDAIRAYTDDGKNYIEWLIANARNNHRNIREEKGFRDDKKPGALLYEMLRHALNLAFSDTGLKLYENAEILNAAQVSEARIDPDFIAVQAAAAAGQIESKWDLIYREDVRLADSGTMVVDHISSLLNTGVINTQTGHLHEVVAALERLKSTPTARLERAFAEHLDCCTYRLDAWLLAFVNLQLYAMRYERKLNDRKVKRGIYLGAYGWVENLKPEDKNLTPAALTPELEKIFNPTGDDAPLKDDTNAGYVHAPSVPQALTAAVLRNAYISNASEDEAEIFKVNLSSERVRMTLGIIEGMQQGQSLGALLGYQLERGLHDRTDQNLDVFIYELRKVFPLASNRMSSTVIKKGKIAGSPEEEQRYKEEEEEFEGDKAIGKIEARNVVDGLSLLEHIKKTGTETYPFGFPNGNGADSLKRANNNQSAAINAEVQRLMNIRDAVADLAMAESVHQVVQGNYDRAAGALDAYSKGHYPQLPDVIQTPGSGVSLTHRFVIHLPSDQPPPDGPTPRSKAEPVVNMWLEDIFPALDDICCKVEYRLPNYEGETPNAAEKVEVSMSNLGLAPIDLMYMLDVASEKNLTALDDCILKYVHEEEKPRPDVEFEIKYTDSIEGKITLFEIAPLIRSLRSLVVAARPLLPTDMMLQNEAGEEQNAACVIDPDRIEEVKQRLDDIRSDLEDDFLDILSPLIDPDDFENTMGNKDQIVAQIDALAGQFADQLHLLNQFGMPRTGFGFIFDRKSAIYARVYKMVLDYKKRWEEKSAAFDDLINNHLDAAATDEEKVLVLQKAERTISTVYTSPAPPVDEYLDILMGSPTEVGKKNLFDDKFNELVAFLDASFINLKDLISAADNLKTNLETFDLTTLETEKVKRQIVVFAEDIKVQADKLNAALLETSGIVHNLLREHDDTAVPKERVEKLTEAAKAIFGNEFQMVPEFSFDAEQRDELQNCLADRDQLLSYQINDLSNDFPVDEWLYGVARVREKLGAWENLVMLAEGFKDRPALNLTPLQLPYKPDDSWLGLGYPPDLAMEGDTLLYTAYMPDFNPSQVQRGLLIDEWTEVIPAKNETTGLTFHYDRPNSEPPQTLLLVTPSAFTGSWDWDDLTGSLKETLDLAKLRAVEPDRIDRTDYAQFLPATVAATTIFPVTMVLNYAMQAHQLEQSQGEENG
jgi:hypothetical protein